MAAVTNPQLDVINQMWQEEKSGRRITTTLSHADLRAAFIAIRDYLDTIRTPFNQAIPQPARGVLTTVEKIEMLMRVLEREVENG